MAMLSREAIEQMGFSSVGDNVQISEKASFYGTARIILGTNVRIDDFCVISGKVTLGRNVHIAIFCNVAGGEMGITLEDFSGLAYGCHVFTQSDDYSGKTLTNPTVPDKYKHESKLAVVVKRHSIVGTCSVIFPGVTLQEGTSIGAMSMVTRSTEAWSVYFGIPAKRLKARSRELLELEQAYLQDEAQLKKAVF